jgi:nucleoside-diphosphate-sugar epimerase
MSGVVLRPGLIWGADCVGGMFYTLLNLADKLPLIPMIGSGNNRLYLSHVVDLVDLISKTVANIEELNSYLLTAASPIPMSLKMILRQCANIKGRAPILVPIPTNIILFTLKLLELAKVPMRIRSDSITGFVYADKKPIFNQDFYRKLGFSGFREF